MPSSPPAKRIRASRASTDIHNYYYPVTAAVEDWEEPLLQHRTTSTADHKDVTQPDLADRQASAATPNGRAKGRAKNDAGRRSPGKHDEGVRNIEQHAATRTSGSKIVTQQVTSEDTKTATTSVDITGLDHDLGPQVIDQSEADDAARSIRTRKSARDSVPRSSEPRQLNPGHDATVRPSPKRTARSSSAKIQNIAASSMANGKHEPISGEDASTKRPRKSTSSQISSQRPDSRDSVPSRNGEPAPRLFIKDFPDPGPQINPAGARMRTVVMDAMAKAVEQGKTKTGDALEQIYCQGLTDPRVQRLLRLAISHEGTEEETQAFHKLVRDAKKTIKAWDAQQALFTEGTVPTKEVFNPTQPIKQESPPKQKKAPKRQSAARSTPVRGTSDIAPTTSPTRSQRKKDDALLKVTSRQATPTAQTLLVHDVKQATTQSSPARKSSRTRHAPSSPAKSTQSSAHTQEPSSPAKPGVPKVVESREKPAEVATTASDARRSTRRSTARVSPDVASRAQDSPMVNEASKKSRQSRAQNKVPALDIEQPDVQRSSRQPRSTSEVSTPVMKTEIEPQSAKTNGVQGDGVDTPIFAPPPVVVNGVKRTSQDADLVNDERDRTLRAKKARLEETTYRDSPQQTASSESYIRSPRDAMRSTRSRDLAQRQREVTPVNETGLTVGSIAQSAKRRAVSGSPLSELSSPPSYRGESPPVIATLAKMGAKKARIKQSPNKQSLPKFDNEHGQDTRQTSPLGSGVEESDNNDFCSSCGGTGYLLCCDGCDKSFHFTCLDPPLDADSSQLNEPWFCHVCVSRRTAPLRHARGLFSALLSNLDKRNPSIFVPPLAIREYFEGVATDKDGSFTEPSAIRTRRAGFDEPPDLLKTRDARGGTILCYACGRSAEGKREIITCDKCSAHWHLDCTSPPMANPPGRDINNRKGKDWLCPLHVEHELRELDPARLAMQRRIHMRRPRHATVRDTQLIRGHVNQGVIDVVEDSSSDDDDEFGEDRTPEGVVYRLPSKGIKLDFIDKIKGYDTTISDTSSSELRQSRFTDLRLLEKKTALSLLQLADDNTDLGLGGDKLDTLLGSLIAEAPASIVHDIDRASDDREISELRALEKLISKRLSTLGAVNS